MNGILGHSDKEGVYLMQCVEDVQIVVGVLMEE